MQVRCIQAAYGHEMGDLVDVPDGAAVSPVFFEPVTPAAAAQAVPPAGPAMPVPVPAAPAADSQEGAQ